MGRKTILFKQLRQAFASFVRAVTLASMSDSMLFMVRWGSTPRALAANAIKMLKACHAPLAGCVLTRVDLEKQTTYTHGEYGYYHGKYKGYYSE